MNRQSHALKRADVIKSSCRTVLLVFLGVCGLTTSILRAADRSNVVGLGMGRTFTATSRGTDAIGINPANLAMPEEGGFNLSLPSLGLRLGTDFLDYGIYRRFFTGVYTDTGRVGYYLTDKDKEVILSGFSSNLGTVNVDANAKLFGISFRLSRIGAFGLSVTERIGAKGILAKGYVRFLLYGNLVGETFTFSNTAIRGWWLRDYSLSYAQSLKNAFGMDRLAFGVGVKLVHGFGYFDAEQKNTFFSTSSQNIVSGRSEYVSHRSGADFFTMKEGASFTPFPSPSGKGWGFDIGLNARVSDHLSIGASITDVGSLQWTHNARVRRGAGKFTIDDPFSKSQRDSLQELLEGVEQKVSAFETALPTAIHFGISFQLTRPESEDRFSPILLALEYTQGLNDMPGNSRRPRYSVGVEIRPLGWLPIRSGFSMGGSERMSLAFGLGLRIGPLGLDFATEDVLGLVDPNTASRISAGMAMRWNF